MTISSRARSSRSIPTPGRWPGTTRRRRTIPTTGTRRTRRSSSTASSEAGSARWSCTPAATATSTSSTASRANTCLTSAFADTVNWAKGLNEKGQPIRIPEKDHHVGGALVSGNNGGATNWPPGSFSPLTGLFYVPLAETYAMYYTAETDPRGAMGLGGKEEITLGSKGSYMLALDYKTGKPAWKHRYPGLGAGSANGLLTTAGGLLFGGDVSGNLVAYDARTARSCGTRNSAAFRTRPRPTCSTGVSTCWSRRATHSSRLRSMSRQSSEFRVQSSELEFGTP